MRNKRRKDKRQIPAAASTTAQPEKLPRIDENVNFWDSRPIWSFALLDLMAPVGGWVHLRRDQLEELLDRFRHWESMTWKQILADGRWRNHQIAVSRCSRDSRERLKALKLDDYDELLSLGVNARARVIGILDRAIFRILWWDPAHQVCPSTLKHT